MKKKKKKKIGTKMRWLFFKFTQFAQQQQQNKRELTFQLSKILNNNEYKWEFKTHMKENMRWKDEETLSIQLVIIIIIIVVVVLFILE